MKWRFFRHLLDGNDADAVCVYLWHIEKRSGSRMAAGLATDQWKRTLDDYVASASSLCRLMAHHGFATVGAVPVDPDGELLDGSHRVACALALGIEAVPVTHEKRKVWAPAWDLRWFIDNGMDEADLSRLRADWEGLASQ